MVETLPNWPRRLMRLAYSRANYYYIAGAFAVHKLTDPRTRLWTGLVLTGIFGDLLRRLPAVPDIHHQWPTLIKRRTRCKCDGHVRKREGGWRGWKSKHRILTLKQLGDLGSVLWGSGSCDCCISFETVSFLCLILYVRVRCALNYFLLTYLLAYLQKYII